MLGWEAIVAILCLVAALLVGQIMVGFSTGVSKPDACQTEPLGLILRLLSLGVFPLTALTQPKVIPGTIYMIGVLVMIAGVWLALWSQKVLGRNWVPGVGLHRGHKLITDGPYRYVRHPLYLGIGILGIGAVICSLNPLVAAAMLLFWLAVATRIPREERLMASKYRGRWTSYRTNTGCLLPRWHRISV